MNQFIDIAVAVFEKSNCIPSSKVKAIIVWQLTIQTRRLPSRVEYTMSTIGPTIHFQDQGRYNVATNIPISPVPIPFSRISVASATEVNPKGIPSVT